MLNRHEPTDPQRKVPPAPNPTLSSLADETPKSSRTAALRNRLSLRRSNASPKNAPSATSPSHSQARDRVAPNRHSGGFFLENPRSKAVTPKANNEQTGTGHNVSARTDRERVRGIRDTFSRSSSRTSDGFGSRTSSRVRESAGGNSSRSATPPPRTTALDGEASEDFQRPSGRISHPTRSHDNPAEIVDLALSLSDSRRRRSNLPSLGHGAASVGGSRLLARDADFNKQEPPVTDIPVVVPLKHQHHETEGEHSQRHGLKPETEADVRPPLVQHHSQSDTRRGQLYDLLPISDATAPPLSGFVPSQATLKRVEKTKAALELAYHHRRLLQYLPDLPHGKPPSTRPGTSHYNQEQRGRTYNPLQYIRNRRMRQREGFPLDPATEGWEDVDRVRAWVNRVAQQASASPLATSFSQNIPPLTPAPPQDLQGSFISRTAHQADLARISRAARLRADWSASPAELLADAHWVHESDNRFSLTDRDGNRLFDKIRHSTSIHERTGSLAKALPTNRGQRDRLSVEVERARSRSSSLQEPPAEDRGRERDQRQSLQLPSEQRPRSTDRKNKKRRNILRSTSPSLRSDISDALPQHITGVVQSMDDKDRSDVMLLRQQLRMMSQGTSSPQQQEGSGNYLDASPQHMRRNIDSIRHMSTDEGEKTLNKHSHRHQRSRAAIGSSDTYAYDSGMSSEHETGNPLGRVLKLPEIFAGSHSSLRPRPHVLESAFSPQSSTQGTNVRTRDSSPDDANIRNGSAREDTMPQTTDHIESDLNLSPSPASTRHRQTRKRIPPFSFGGSPRSAREREESDSKLRGLIRGAKLAELMSAPAAKVGDLLWRKPESEHRVGHFSTATISLDDGEPGIQDTIMADSDSARTGRNRRQGYHLDNLPVFKSPFKGSSAASVEDSPDPISRQVEELRHKRSQSRFDRLAPPSLDMRSVSGTPSRPMTPNDERREGSSEYQSPGNVERRSALIGSNLNLNRDDQQEVQESGALHLERWSPDRYMHAIARPDIVSKTGKVTKKDIRMLGALMTSCAVQSNELVRRAIGDRAHKAGRRDRATSSTSNGSSLACFKQTTGIDVGKNLLTSIDSNFNATREVVSVFAEDTTNDLHKQLQELHKELSEDVTGAVRGAERAADELGSELALDYTLEVRRLNETIDLVMRRRRRRMRWLRRTGFSLLEWAVLAVMWWVWLVVVVFRLARGTVKVFYRTTRWLLWL